MQSYNRFAVILHSESGPLDVDFSVGIGDD